jgi:molybdopterin converting factor small subunit
MIVFSAVVSLFAIYLMFVRSPDDLQLPLVLTLGAAALAALAFFYLEPGSIGKPKFPADLETFSRIKHYVDGRIDKAIGGMQEGMNKAPELTEQDKIQIFASIQTKLESDAFEKYLAELKESVRTQAREEIFDNQFQDTRYRLEQELQALTKRGNLNLTLGIFTTMVGIVFLGYAVFNPPAVLTAPELFLYFAPRVSLVVLIEVFAYFFLRLYKQSLGEIKFFQNEMTNIEAKYLALQVVLRADDPALYSKIVEALAETERNFILAKGQTTVELERERLTKDIYVGIADAFNNLIKKK